MRFCGIVLLFLAALSGPALAESCPGNPDAIGVSRTITVDPAKLPQIGGMQYRTTLPLNDHEVVITFDDGPLPPYTERILDILKANCVKATYFLVGMQAQAYPWLVRRIYNDGQTIGTHSEHHPFRFNSMPLPRIESEVDGGIAAVTKAVGDPRAVSPFFRIPGLAHGARVDTFLASQKLTVWSADEVADDWRHGVTAADIVRLAISRIEAKNHRGVLLLHDIHPNTARALPELLKQLKERGYHIVQVVAPGERPKSVPVLPEPTVIAKLDKEPLAELAARHHAATHAAKRHPRGKALSARRHHRRLHNQASGPHTHKADHAALAQKTKRF